MYYAISLTTNTKFKLGEKYAKKVRCRQLGEGGEALGHRVAVKDARECATSMDVRTAIRLQNTYDGALAVHQERANMGILEVTCCGPAFGLRFVLRQEVPQAAAPSPYPHLNRLSRLSCRRVLQ